MKVMTVNNNIDYRIFVFVLLRFLENHLHLYIFHVYVIISLKDYSFKNTTPQTNYS